MRLSKLAKILFPIVVALISISAQAQNTGTIRGFVYDEDTGEPIIFTNVYLKGTNMGVATDVNGYYSITKIPRGDYTLTVTYLGYDTLEVPISIKKGDIITRTLTIGKKAVEIGTVIISAEKAEAQKTVKVSVEKITPKEIEQLPSVGGQTDLAQYLQVLPGVIFTGDQGGQLYIRGGSPIQNKVLLDGMIIYNPFHSIGLFSVFDTDILRNADIYTGGFTAQYGGRISSIMDITTRDGNKRELDGKLSLNTFGAKALIEGPLNKQDTPGGASSSFILSAKQSYLDETSKQLYDYVNDGDGLPFSFTDVYGKVSFNGVNGSKVNLFGFSFNDQVTYQAISDLSWNTVGVGSSFILVPGGSRTLISGNMAWSDYEINLEEEELAPRSSSISGFNFGLNFKYFSGDDELNYGIELLGFSTNFTTFNDIGIKLVQEENTSEIAGFFSYRLKRGILVLEPGIRMHYYSSLKNLSPEPRLGAKVNITENLRIKAAAGLYSQNLLQSNSDRDVVNLFYGFLSGPEELQDEFTTEELETREVSHKLQKAAHLIAGVEYDLTDKVSVNVEGYVKDFTQLINVNRNKIFEDDPTIDAPEVFKKDFIIETGLAKGVDFVLKYKSNSFDIWTVYSLNKVDRWDGIQSYSPIFDRRHNVNLLGSYYFGKNKDWTVSARWNYGSGLPFTQNQGFYQGFEIDEIGTDITTQNPGDVSLQLAALNEGRLSDYHRFDLSIEKLFEFTRTKMVDDEEKTINTGTLEVTAGVTNLYDRENIFYVDRVRNLKVFQLPILPSLGINWEF